MVKSYIKVSNKFLKELCSLPQLPYGIILCKMDVVELYLNILHEEGQSAFRKGLASGQEKYVSTGTVVDLAEVVLKK